eukprot:9516448-Alexandrium_andersonii.AAC.1
MASWVSGLRGLVCLAAIDRPSAGLRRRRPCRKAEQIAALALEVRPQPSSHGVCLMQRLPIRVGLVAQ